MQMVGDEYLLRVWGPDGQWCPDMSTVMARPGLVRAWEESGRALPPPVARAQVVRAYAGMIDTRDDEAVPEREGWGRWWAGVMADAECHAHVVNQAVTGGR